MGSGIGTLVSVPRLPQKQRLIVMSSKPAIKINSEVQSHDPAIGDVKEASVVEINNAEDSTTTTKNPDIKIQRKKKPIPWKRYTIRVSAIFVAIVIWQICSQSGFEFIINFQNIPTPMVVGKEFLVQLNTPEFYKHIAVSLERILIGFAMASIMGVLLGIFMGRSRIMFDIFMPYIEILRPIPAVAWIPLAILMLPTEESSIIYITFLGALFPIVLNTVHGVEQTPETLVRAARSLGASNRAIMWHVILPGAPSIICTGQNE